MLQDGATETVQDQENKPTEDSISREQFEQLTNQLELTKKELSSRDSKISEYQKSLNDYKTNIEELKNANLTEAEKTKLELDKLKMEIQSERSERTRATNKAEAIKLMNENGIDTDLIGLVPLDDVEGMKTAIETLSNSAKKHMQQGAQSVVNKIGVNSSNPVGSMPQGTITIEQYRALPVAEQNKVLSEGRLTQ